MSPHLIDRTCSRIVLLVLVLLAITVACAAPRDSEPLTGSPANTPSEPATTPTDKPTPTPADEPTATATDKPTPTPTDEPAATATDEPAPTQKVPVAPSDIEEQALEPHNRYTIAIPAGYTGEESVPLILALHYGGHGTPYYGKYILTGLVEPALRELEAIIVAPDCTGYDWTDPKSESDVIALLDHVQEAYNIDPQKVLVTGYSMGGIGTWHLAARHQDWFTAALVMAGVPPSDAAERQWAIPLYVIHSRADELLPLEPTETAVSQLQDRGVPVELVILEGITHYETGRFAPALRAAIPWIEQAWQQ